jgi:hypothetical protein
MIESVLLRQLERVIEAHFLTIYLTKMADKENSRDSSMKKADFLKRHNRRFLL